MKRDIHAQARLVDLLDDEIRAFLGATYEALKDLDEKKKVDVELERRLAYLHEYLDPAYNDKVKKLKADLKACRAVAKARGIKFTVPRELLNDEP